MPPPVKGTIVEVIQERGIVDAGLTVHWDGEPEENVFDINPERLEWADEGRRRLTEEDIPSQSYLHSAEEVIARRRLVDHARMEAQDADAMSPSELAMHRRRLAHGARVSPVLAALMDEIEEAKHNHS